MDAEVNMVSGGKNLSSPFSRPKKKLVTPCKGWPEGGKGGVVTATQLLAGRVQEGTRGR